MVKGFEKKLVVLVFSFRNGNTDTNMVTCYNFYHLSTTYPVFIQVYLNFLVTYFL